MTRASLALFILAALAPALAADLPAAAEICRFAALDRENPFRRWLHSQEVVCADARSPVAVPPGFWNIFARAEGAISTAPMLIEGDSTRATIAAPPLIPAATLSLRLPEKHAGVVYVPRHGSALPVDGARVAVPASEPLWLFVLDGANLVAIHPIAPLAAGSERIFDARAGGGTTIVGWIRVPEPDRTRLANAAGLAAPGIRAGGREAEPLPPAPHLHGSFLLVRDASAGASELRVDGRGWIPQRRTLNVRPGVTTIAAPLLIRASGTLVVHWNTTEDLRALDAALGSCEEPGEEPQLVIAVARCPERRRGIPPFEECTPFREERVREHFGSLTFDDVLPGHYRAEMRYGKLPRVDHVASVPPLGVADLRMLAHFDTVSGSVTRGGEPIEEEVRIEFPRGAGYASADADEYRAVVAPRSVDVDSRITVAACDGAPRAVVLADRPLLPHARFDIDIPANALAIQVSDTFTREPLRGAAVTLEAMSLRRPGNVVYTARGTSNEEGKVVWTAVPQREIHLEVSLAGYEKRRLDPFTMPRSETRTLDVQLVPLRGTRGRVVSPVPFESGVVMWYSPAGLETERAELAADGSFMYANRHAADETMTVASASHPLWVLRTPDTDRRDGIALRFPEMPPLALEVWLAKTVPPNESRNVGVMIGGLRVPQPALDHHQNVRNDSVLLRGSGPHPIRDLLATGPIDVLLGPVIDGRTIPMRNRDLFSLPQYADAPRVRLEPGASEVVFATTMEER